MPSNELYVPSIKVQYQDPQEADSLVQILDGADNVLCWIAKEDIDPLIEALQNLKHEA